MNSLTFNPQRFWLLLQKELWSGNKKPLIVAGAVFGFILTLALFMIYTDDGYEHLNFNIFPMVILGGGFIFTSVIYYEFNDKTGTHHYLSLPASTFEKFISKWFITAIVFPIVAVFLFWIYAKIGDGIYNNYADSNISTWSVTNWWSKFFIKLYFVLQSIFLVGAIAFQKYTLFKTALTGFLASVLFVLIMATIFRIMFPELFSGLFTASHDANLVTTPKAAEYMETTFLNITEYACWILIPIIMWTVGFFKLKEKEA